MEYALILAAVLLISPFVLSLAASQNKKTKQNLRILFLSFLAIQIILGFLNWETFQGPGKSGFELALTFPYSYLWLFFTITFAQILLLIPKKHTLDIVSVTLNFINTVVLFATMIILSSILGKQVVSPVSIGTIFIVLIGNVVGLVLVNKDKNLIGKYLQAGN